MIKLAILLKPKPVKAGNIFSRMCFLLSMLLLFTKGYSTNYYIATNGQSSNSGTSVSSPFKDISQAIALASAGDTIFVRSGTYLLTSRITVSKTGNQAKRICIFAYPPDVSQVFPNDGRPIFDFSGMAAGSSNQGFLLSGSQYLHIKELKIYGAGDNGMILRNSNNNIIEFCDFYKNRDSGFQMMDGSSDNLIINCDSYMNADMGQGTSTLGGNADGFAPKLTVGSGNVFKGCRAWLNSDDGWDGYLKTEGTIYPDGMTTTLENCWTWSNGYYWLDGSTNAEMNGNGFKMGGSTNKNLAHNFILKRCLSFFNKSKGFDQNSDAGSITLYNCTAHSNGSWEYMLNSSGVTYATGSVFTVKNCISLSSLNNTFRTGTVLQTNNFSTTESDFISIDTSGISGRRFLNGELPEIEFMHLQTSPQTGLIDAGTVIDGIVYTGSKPDLGCFEVGIISNNPEVEVTNNDLRISPNPADEYIQFTQMKGNEDVYFYSLDGKLLKHLLVKSDDEKIDISEIEKGIYIVKTKYHTFKLIKL